MFAVIPGRILLRVCVTLAPEPCGLLACPGQEVTNGVVELGRCCALLRAFDASSTKLALIGKPIGLSFILFK